MGQEDHLGHFDKGQQNHQTYHPEVREVEADILGSSHSSGDADADPSWGK